MYIGEKEMAGLDGILLNNLNYKKAINRIANDSLHDFVFAPHYSAIFKYAPEELWNILKQSLNSGVYNPQLPITIEVPKKSGLTRPGSILNPIDRLLYQCIADVLAPEIEKSLDRKSVFSQILSENDEPESGKMFESPSICYGELRNKIYELCSDEKYGYVIVADIACYFERIYQHVLINLLRSTESEAGYINLLERLLSALTSKDSHGIIQGVYPSDLLGNFYLCAFDSYLKLKNVEFIRYVDDYWIFFRTLEEAQQVLADICTYVRKEGLYLNEYKTRIISTRDLQCEETELDRLFNAARDEINSWDIVYSEYSFEPLEFERFEDEADLEVQAITRLYLIRNETPNFTERIDKFCLPRLAINKLDFAVQDAIEGLISRPHIADVYCQYLKAFIDTDLSISDSIQKAFIENKFNYEWQMMWVLGMFYHSDNINMDVVDKVYSILHDYNIPAAVRAICPLIVSKHGDGSRRRLIRNHYSSEPSSYVKEAILYSTKFFPSNDDKNTCISTWETHSDINKLIAIALRKEGR
jgi:hypothetical protein